MFSFSDLRGVLPSTFVIGALCRNFELAKSVYLIVLVSLG